MWRSRPPSSSFLTSTAAFLLLALLRHGSAGWVDPDTMVVDYVVKSLKDGTELDLIFSDEFNVWNRTFADGEDPTWTALDHSDDARSSVGEGSLIFYNHSYVTTTKDGKLNITTSAEATKWKGFNPYKRKYDIFQKPFRGGMIQSWNKFCFVGGAVEISIKLPGKPDVGGLWPAFWLMGNLGRALYEHSTNMMWPWSFDECDRDQQEAQEISACDITRHWDLMAGKGRGATEIDVLEVMPGTSPPIDPDDNYSVPLPQLSTTLQVSPGVKLNRPAAGKPVAKGHNWYEDLKFGEDTKQNIWFYGTLLDKTNKDEPTGRSVRQVYQADALSALTGLNDSFWNQYHRFRLEWQPGDEGYVAWYLNDKFLYEITAKSLRNATGAKIPEEPSYLILNTAVSTTWGFPRGCPEGCPCNCYDCSKPECRCALPEGFCETLPADMLVDWIRVYQNKNDPSHLVGCDHPKFPTRKFIQGHRWRYQRDSENQPLQDIQTGKGHCHKDQDCHPGGSCLKKQCKCKDGWVGPHCKQPDYHDDIDFEAKLNMPFVKLHVAPSMTLLTSLVMIGLTTAVIVIATKRHDEVEHDDDDDERPAQSHTARLTDFDLSAVSANPMQQPRQLRVN